MSQTNSEIAWLLLREKIRDCLARLARAEDRRDAAGITAAFHADATVDYGIFSGSFDDYLAWVVPGSAAIVTTLHTLGQSVIELQADVALAETHVTSYHRVDTGDAQQDMVIGGRYLDRFECRCGSWRIVQRTMLYDWFRNFGVSVDWSQGLMGMPFDNGRYTAQTADDFSETFFSALRTGR